MREHVITLKNEVKPVIYDLYGVSNHFGNLNGGHYTAYVKNCVDKKWYAMNDSVVEELSESHIVTNAAYLLFYRLRD